MLNQTMLSNISEGDQMITEPTLSKKNKKKNKKKKNKKNKIGESEDASSRLTKILNNAGPNNYVRLQKYTWYNFLPYNLYKQFKKYLNLYFLILSGLQMIEVFSVTDKIPTLLIPLITLIVVTLIKDKLLDNKKGKIATEMNSRKT